jgi:hypothetical protein
MAYERKISMFDRLADAVGVLYDRYPVGATVAAVAMLAASGFTGQVVGEAFRGDDQPTTISIELLCKETVVVQDLAPGVQGPVPPKDPRTGLRTFERAVPCE